ncbi:hypothetical protein VA596_41415 [Amycolatopsis sp., V23-08]|uniref:DUF3618 domain-containing protein n=1 Tax=Amycolatopsis heterodermiae TaxID=3110235 RepID=A0ABU5RIC5_9PSEU|nr:hypothetical protein [Amycolatopsis sp., V23-08]MEA5366046.1 hypothetical protein [Amycolatopsis sp., V23-08]
MSILRKIVERIDKAADKKIDTTVERAGVKPADRKSAPKKAPKADSSVVAPTPLSGGCSLRVLQAAGFAGVVVATLAAAVAGRWRR